MATQTLQTAHAIRVPDRAGDLVINRLVWPVTKETNGDKVVIGYVPANCKVHALASQVIANGATTACKFDVCVGEDTNKVAAAVTVTASTFLQAALTTAALCETLATSTNNRPVYLLLETAPTAAGGKIIVDLAVFDPGA